MSSNKVTANGNSLKYERKYNLVLSFGEAVDLSPDILSEADLL